MTFETPFCIFGAKRVFKGGALCYNDNVEKETIFGKRPEMRKEVKEWAVLILPYWQCCLPW